MVTQYENEAGYFGPVFVWAAVGFGLSFDGLAELTAGLLSLLQATTSPPSTETESTAAICLLRINFIP
ncbi:hypothetical protein D3C85_1759800 [compost metagenome]